MTIERIKQMKSDLNLNLLQKRASFWEISEAFDLAEQKLLEREKLRKRMAKRRKAMKKVSRDI